MERRVGAEVGLKVGDGVGEKAVEGGKEEDEAEVRPRGV